VFEVLETLNERIKDDQLSPELCWPLIQMEEALGDSTLTYRSKLMERVHKAYQESAITSSESVSELDIIKYLNIVPCRVPLDYKLGQKIVNAILSAPNGPEHQLTLLRETFKLAFSKPGFQELLEGLELDEIEQLNELVQLANEK
jgi:hypothetical protein